MCYAIAVLSLLFPVTPLALAADANPKNASTENTLRETVRSHPEAFRSNHALGEFYIQQHNLKAAIPYLEKARRIDPDNYDNSYDLALAFLQTGAAGKSREVVISLLDRNDKAELHNLLGDIEAAEEHVQESARQYEIAARMEPTEKNLFDLGSFLVQHRGFEQALKVFEFAVQRYPNSAQLQVGKGIAHYSSGQYDEAVESLCHAVDLDPKDKRALDFLGKMYDVSPRFADEVTKRLARFASVYPGDATVNYYYALSLRKRALSAGPAGSEAEAEALLLKAVKLDPNLAEAHLELGLLYEDQKQDAKAIREYQAATKLSAGLSKAHYRLGRLYQRNGQPVLAQKEFHAFEALKTGTR